MASKINITYEEKNRRFKLRWNGLPFLAGYTSGFSMYSYHENKLWCIDVHWNNGEAIDEMTILLDSEEKWRTVLALLDKI